VGDIAENPDVRIALGEVSRIEGRLRVIREKLRYATVVAGGGSVVGTGSIVTVEFSQGECETYLFGSVEDRHDDYDVLSAESPIGLAIGGAAVGESVEVGIGGKVVVVRVVALS
jgi:transcription elongation GreA/GreB family factor